MEFGENTTPPFSRISTATVKCNHSSVTFPRHFVVLQQLLSCYMLIIHDYLTFNFSNVRQNSHFWLYLLIKSMLVILYLVFNTASSALDKG